MAWTAPRTWVTAELVTAAVMNTHVRDNELFLFDHQVIQTTTLGADAASISFSSIPTTYTHLRLLLHGRGTTAATAVNAAAQFNGDTGNNYDRQRSDDGVISEALLTSSVLVGRISAASMSAGFAGSLVAYILGYNSTSFHKQVVAESTYVITNDLVSNQTNSNWRSTSAITSILVFPDAGNFLAGTVATLQGI